MDTKQMLQTNPKGTAADAEALHMIIDSCFGCTRVCTTCADACVSEDNLEVLAHRIRLDLDRTEVCDVTGRIFPTSGFRARRGAVGGGGLRPSSEAGGDECEKHSEHHGHRRAYINSCSRCQEACEGLLKEL